MPEIDEKSAATYTFNDLNNDLDELYVTLKKENYKNHDIKRFIDPILSKLPKNQRLEKIIVFVYKAALITFSLITITYFLTYWDRFYWHLTAIARIFLIKILPYWDWRYLKNEVCLVPNFFDQKGSTQNQETFNCDLCESLTNFDQFSYNVDHDIEDLIRRFIDIDRPVIIKGGIEHWIKESPDVFIDQLINEKELARSIPCKLSTNIHNLRKGDVDVLSLRQRTKIFDGFFMHFQNCELEAMKIFRKYTYRPDVLPAELSPVTYNWLLWNKHHNTTKFKKINLIEKYTVIGQLFGKTRLKLLPRKNCENVCPILEEILPKGHFLVLTSLWDLEYLPDRTGENVAAVLEVKG